MKISSASTFDLSRQRFVQGTTMGGAVASLGPLRSSNAWAVGRNAAVAGSLRPYLLSGADFALDIAESPINYTGVGRVATTINGGIPGKVLRWKEGSTVTSRVTNHLRVMTSIHRHGVLLPLQMDGVPGTSYEGIAPGETLVYRFPVRQRGNCGYHSPSGLQEHVSVHGPIVSEPADAERRLSERDGVVMLNGWSDSDPSQIFATLKRQGGYCNFAEPTAPELFRDLRDMGLQGALAKRGDAGGQDAAAARRWARSARRQSCHGSPRPGCGERHGAWRRQKRIQVRSGRHDDAVAGSIGPRHQYR